SSPIAPTATTARFVCGCMRASSSTCSPSRPRSVSTGRRRPSPCRNETGASVGAGPVARPDREPESVRVLAERLPKRAWKTLPCRTTPAGEDVSSRFAFVRVVATHPVRTDCLPPREEWLIIEWPEGAEAPSDYWLSNLPAETGRERLARLARLRWT